jgi:hypothetical protein
VEQRFRRCIKVPHSPRFFQLRCNRCPFGILNLVRMIWWFLIVLVAAGAVVWAALSAYVRVHQGLTKAENRPAEQEHHESDHDL